MTHASLYPSVDDNYAKQLTRNFGPTTLTTERRLLAGTISCTIAAFITAGTGIYLHYHSHHTPVPPVNTIHSNSGNNTYDVPPARAGSPYASSLHRGTNSSHSRTGRSGAPHASKPSPAPHRKPSHRPPAHHTAPPTHRTAPPTHQGDTRANAPIHRKPKHHKPEHRAPHRHRPRHHKPTPAPTTISPPLVWH